MPSVRTVATADLDPAGRAAIRRLLDLSFDGEFTDDDWDHTLGGQHFTVTVGGMLVAHAAVVQRRFLHDDRSWRGGYVEGVAVHPECRRQGLGNAVMAAAEHVIDRAFDLGALSTSADGRGLYLRRGWLVWQGPTAVLAPAGLTRTADDDGGTFVRIVPGGADLRRTGTLACDWRDGDVW
ncbi:GNAT family N-acetyltransferase [Paractinoplanes rishiriensis]|uniref:Aminoglycoside 2'-N-acetyltransferase n=1 Tax=Paractinoplanes rishiriensis TaxID=1050105 RepID=A0A919MRJ3_9ACTN|nr:GNAT family N-acetyltransferase [Actinoplanes rishiriensis]GIE97266.1 aminoglycoside 2'-N-acetyltransferase [Actinoplanes rishiriensis]